MRDRIECCRYCEDKRKPGCHATCEDYIREKAEHDEFLAKQKAEKQVRSYFQSQQEDIKDKTAKRRRKQKNYYHTGNTD